MKLSPSKTLIGKSVSAKVAFFSSRGPSSIAPEILKVDFFFSAFMYDFGVITILCQMGLQKFQLQVNLYDPEKRKRKRGT